MLETTAEGLGGQLLRNNGRRHTSGPWNRFLAYHPKLVGALALPITLTAIDLIREGIATDLDARRRE